MLLRSSLNRSFVAGVLSWTSQGSLQHSLDLYLDLRRAEKGKDKV